MAAIRRPVPVRDHTGWVKFTLEKSREQRAGHGIVQSLLLDTIGGDNDGAEWNNMMRYAAENALISACSCICIVIQSYMQQWQRYATRYVSPGGLCYAQESTTSVGSHHVQYHCQFSR